MQYPGNLTFGRMTKAFSQQFYGFALETTNVSLCMAIWK